MKKLKAFKILHKKKDFFYPEELKGLRYDVEQSKRLEEDYNKIKNEFNTIVDALKKKKGFSEEMIENIIITSLFSDLNVSTAYHRKYSYLSTNVIRSLLFIYLNEVLYFL